MVDSLFFSIRAAIQDNQTELINRVLKALETLQKTYDVQYPNTRNSKMSTVRDIPPISGQVLSMNGVDVY